MARIDLKNTTVTIKDGAGSPNTLAVRIGDGNITYDVTHQFDYTKDRGLLDTVRKGNEVPVDIKLDATYTELELPTSDSPQVSVEDFLKKRGNASAFVTAGADPCEPYAVTIIIEQNQNCGANTDETITITEFRYEKASHDIKAGTISFTGKAKITVPTIVRS